ncbi:hypothetical protein BKA93DRAFT_829975 [Sparassis latifolia]|uniref:Oxidase ustYa n=1 Tax=Sparassis crispa TaxID=139825 RepID=A0A401H4J5_9APHY|nr:hypothetical protein SCP_1502780 [Sparassis crispa]GBE89270.1 hypothetical protein SCP_1502780 [Sparassis crispa]
MRQRVQLPFALIVCGVCALTVSLLVHITSAIQYLHSQSSLGQTRVAEFSIPIRYAALSTVKSPRLGLYASDAEWRSLLPSGEGFLYLPSDGEHYLVSHYHQLHCLRSLRMYFLKHDNLSEADWGHVDHCLIYLHQMLLCNVDLTLEPANHKQLTPDGRLTNAVTGIDVTHRCKDWAQVRGFMESNYEQWGDTYKTEGTSP